MEHKQDPNIERYLRRARRLYFGQKTLRVRHLNYSANRPSPESATDFWLFTIASLLNQSYRKDNKIKIVVKN